MQKKIILFIYLFPLYSFSNVILTNVPNKLWPKLLKNNIYVKSKVNDYYINKNNIKIHKQKLDFTIYALHKKKCRIALNKISQYENYSSYIGFIKKSYFYKTKNIFFLEVDSLLLPSSFILNFSINRVNSIGTYPFEFKSGILPGLKGVIDVSSIKKRCLFKIRAKWDGNYSQFPNIVFEMFSSILGKLAIKRMFEISQTY